MRRTPVILIAVFMLTPVAARSGPYTASSPVKASGSSPFTGCTTDNAASQPRPPYPSVAWGPSIAVNPTNPNHVVGAWLQDRYPDRGARGVVAGVSFNGGASWTQAVIPGTTRCSCGSFDRAGIGSRSVAFG